MERVIKLTATSVFLGQENGTFVEVDRSHFTFEPQIDDVVRRYESGEDFLYVKEKAPQATSSVTEIVSQTPAEPAVAEAETEADQAIVIGFADGATDIVVTSADEAISPLAVEQPEVAEPVSPANVAQLSDEVEVAPVTDWQEQTFESDASVVTETPQASDEAGVQIASQSKPVAGLLGIFLGFLGFLGIHNFYIGRKMRGFVQLGLTILNVIAIFAYFMNVIAMIEIYGEIEPEAVTGGFIVLGLLSTLSWFVLGATYLWGFVEGVLILISQPGRYWHKNAAGQELRE